MSATNVFSLSSLEIVLYTSIFVSFKRKKIFPIYESGFEKKKNKKKTITAIKDIR